jgi:hypothetical protein
MYPSCLGVRSLQRIDTLTGPSELSSAGSKWSGTKPHPEASIPESHRIALLGQLRSVSVSGSAILSQRVRRENAAALETGKEPTAGDLFTKGLFPGFKALGVSNTSGPLELLRIHGLPAPTAAKAKGVVVSVEKRNSTNMCERDGANGLGSWFLVKSALGAPFDLALTLGTQKCAN